MLRTTKIVLGVDPGRTTGLFIVGPGIATAWDDVEEFAAVDRVVYFFKLFQIDHVVIEKFNVFEKRTRKAARDIGWPLDVIGAVRYTSYVWKTPVAMQSNMVKNKVDDGLLDEWGWRNPRFHHANDAARHTLAFVMKNELYEA